MKNPILKLFFFFSFCLVFTIEGHTQCFPADCENPVSELRSTYVTFPGYDCAVPVYYFLISCEEGAPVIDIISIRTEQGIGQGCDELIEYLNPNGVVNFERVKQAFLDAVGLVAKDVFLTEYFSTPESLRGRLECPNTWRIRSTTFKHCTRFVSFSGPFMKIESCSAPPVCCIHTLYMCYSNGPEIDSEQWSNQSSGNTCPSTEPPPPTGGTASPCYQPCEDE